MEELNLKYLALIRRINVGGKNIIPKNELVQVFKDLGYSNILTYIQSGNILFRSKDTDTQSHVNNIEKTLANRHSIHTKAVVYTENDYKSILNEAPDNWGRDENYRHRIFFLLGNISPKEIMKNIGTPEKSIETIALGPNVIYSSVSKVHLSRSVLRKIPTTPAYQYFTIRNHNTVYKLNLLFDEI